MTYIYDKPFKEKLNQMRNCISKKNTGSTNIMQRLMSLKSILKQIKPKARTLRNTN